jgi:signal peptidase I
MRSVTRQVPRIWRENRAFILFVFLMLMFRSAWADWMTVPTGSMNPTIIEGDRIVVDKHVFGLRLPWTLIRLTDGRDPQRGEIVVFDSPVDGTSLVKRCAGLPGDEIALDDGGLWINGQYASYRPGDREVIHGLLTRVRMLEPTVLREGGVIPEHDVLRLPHSRPQPGLARTRIPDGMYFMLGDSRDNSRDSRYFGFVPRRNIVGLTSRVAVSFDPERYYLPRRDRWMQPLE